MPVRTADSRSNKKGRARRALAQGLAPNERMLYRFFTSASSASVNVSTTVLAQTTLSKASHGERKIGSRAMLADTTR